MESATGPRVAISGASGFLGSALAAALEADGVTVLRLVRRKSTRPGDVLWDPVNAVIDTEPLEGIDAVVHLAGESISGVWSPAKKKRIFESRSAGTRLLASALSRLGTPPRAFISASAVGYYGNSGEAVLTEQDPPGDDFLAKVCIAWEDATASAVRAGIRVVNPRFGLILDPGGGAFPLMAAPFRFGLGPRLGSGRQWLSWISLADAVRVLQFCLDSGTLEGPVNAVAPQPIRNAEFTSLLGKALRRPTFLIAPSFVLRAATGGMADSLLLTSQRVLPEVLSGEGFTFTDPTFEDFLIRRMGWTPRS